SAMLDGPMKDPSALGWPQSVTLKPELEFGRLLEKSRLHTGFLWALGAALFLHWLQRATAFGFEMQAVGSNARAARHLGIPVARVVLGTAVLSGALAGLAGVAEVAGRTGYVTLDMSPGCGRRGLVSAMLAGRSPLWAGVCALVGARAAV